MKSNIAAQMMSAAGEIFSHGATSADDEKSNATPVNAPAPAYGTTGDVTLISKSDHTCRTVEKMQDAEFVADLRHLTKMQLRQKYRREEASHRNMLTRSKRRGNIVHPDFQEFRDFLRRVGPMPASRATLDRIDNTDPEYAPGKVRWADKRTQNNNKGDTLIFHNQETSEVFTAAQLAKLQGVEASTIRKRRERGWSDAQVIVGTRLSPPATSNKQLPLSSSPRADEPREKTPQIVSLRSRSARDIKFEQMAEEIAFYREHYGVEEMLAPPSVINEGHPEAWHVTDEQWLVHFKRLWPEYRPHIIFERADPYHQRVIELIDPEYVRRQRAKSAESDELKPHL